LRKIKVTAFEFEKPLLLRQKNIYILSDHDFIKLGPDL